MEVLAGLVLAWASRPTPWVSPALCTAMRLALRPSLLGANLNLSRTVQDLNLNTPFRQERP